MTTRNVRIRLLQPDRVTYAAGAAIWTPTRRTNAAEGLILPSPMVITVGADTTIPVALTASDWCWQVRENVRGGSTRYVSVVAGDGSTIAYESLPDVDPATLDPAAIPPAAWTTALAAVQAELDQTIFPTTTTITYNGDGTVASVTAAAVTTTYAYNGDGTVHTDTRSGVTRTYTYDGSGNLTGIAA